MTRPTGRRRSNKRSKTTNRSKKKDPVYVDGKRPRPMYVDYKNVDLLKKLVNRHGRIVGRRKTGCAAASLHAITTAIKRARFMALMPYTGEGPRFPAVTLAGSDFPWKTCLRAWCQQARIKAWLNSFVPRAVLNLPKLMRRA